MNELTFTYLNNKGSHKITIDISHPIEFKWYDNNYFMIAFDKTRNKIKPFLVHYIVEGKDELIKAIFH